MFIVTENDGEKTLATFLDPPPRVVAHDGSRVVLVNFSPVRSTVKPCGARASRSG